MAKEWAKEFYASVVWERQREAYRRHVHGICERCGEPGKIVHHRRPLTPKTIHDPQQTLAFENLELLCRDCHAAAHEGELGRKRRKDVAEGMRFNARGEMVPERIPPRGDERRGRSLPKRGSLEKPTGRA